MADIYIFSVNYKLLLPCLSIYALYILSLIMYLGIEYTLWIIHSIILFLAVPGRRTDNC